MACFDVWWLLERVQALEGGQILASIKERAAPVGLHGSLMGWHGQLLIDGAECLKPAPLDTMGYHAKHDLKVS